MAAMRRLSQLYASVSPSPSAAASAAAAPLRTEGGGDLLDCVPRGKEENYDTEAFQRRILAIAPPGTTVDPLTKFIGFSRRDPRKIDRPELFKVWKDPHMPNVIQGWKPRRYIVTQFEEDPANAKRAPRAHSDGPFDGMAIMWFKDFAEYMSLAKPYMQSAGASDPLASNIEVIVIAAYREYVVSPGPREGCKMTFLIRRKPDVPLDKFYEGWLSYHAADTKRTVEIACPGKQVRISMSVATEQQRTSTPVEGRQGEWKSGKGIDWCGVKEMWFPDRATMDAYTSTMQSGAGMDSLPKEEKKSLLKSLQLWDTMVADRYVFFGTEHVGIP